MLLSGIRNASFSMRLLHSKRVISPHLSIYKPQITWILSIGHRITGAFVGGVLYSTAIAYTINPQKTTQFIALLTASKTRSSIHEKLSLRNVTKLILSAPIIFHTFNGVRHLVSKRISSLMLTPHHSFTLA